MTIIKDSVLPSSSQFQKWLFEHIYHFLDSCSLTNKSLFSQMVNKPLSSFLKAQELNYVLVGLDISPICKKFKCVIMQKCLSCKDCYKFWCSFKRETKEHGQFLKKSGNV